MIMMMMMYRVNEAVLVVYLTLIATMLPATSVCATPGRTSAAGGGAALIPGVAVAVSTQPVDRSSVRLNTGRVTTRDVGPLAVSVGGGLPFTPGDKRPPDGAAAASWADASTFTGDSSMFVSRPSSSSVVFTMSTVGSAGLCDTAADILHSFLSYWMTTDGNVCRPNESDCNAKDYVRVNKF